MVNGVVGGIGVNDRVFYDSFDGVKRTVVAEIMKAGANAFFCEIFLSCFASITIATQQS